MNWSQATLARGIQYKIATSRLSIPFSEWWHLPESSHWRSRSESKLCPASYQFMHSAANVRFGLGAGKEHLGPLPLRAYNGALIHQKR